MGKSRHWMPLLATAAGDGAAYRVIQRITPFDVASPWFVVVAMICFLGLAFVAQPLVMIRMPRVLRTIRAWEINGGVYRALGVPAYGRLLRRTPLRLFNRDVYLQDGLPGTQRVGAELEAAEASHFWAAVLVVPYMVHAALAEEVGSPCWESRSRRRLSTRIPSCTCASAATAWTDSSREWRSGGGRSKIRASMEPVR